jgi:hypothetical protein
MNIFSITKITTIMIMSSDIGENRAIESPEKIENFFVIPDEIKMITSTWMYGNMT